MSVVLTSPRPDGDALLEDVVLAALSAARVRQAGRRPVCPVCGEAMWSFDRDGGAAELCCSGCGSRLWDEAAADGLELRLTA
jgi:tRNA(Ile2) C34 agmatinyltransferase TiaS